MSTNSYNAYIGMVTDQGKIRYIYAHWDGYLSGVGDTLLENYTTTAEVEELLSHGDVSTLEETVADSEFYHRDLGQPLQEVSARTAHFLHELNQEYNYVWTGTEWVVEFGRKGWYKLAYIVEAEIVDAEDYVFNKQAA